MQEAMPAAPSSGFPIGIFIILFVVIFIISCFVKNKKQSDLPPTSRMVYVLLAVTVGMLGVHNFSIGLNKKGVINIALTASLFLIPINLIMVIYEIITTRHDSDNRLLP